MRTQYDKVERAKQECSGKKDGVLMLMCMHITHGLSDGSLIHSREWDSLADNIIKFLNEYEERKD